MLSPDYLDLLPDSVVELYSKVEIEIIKDIVRRITKAGYFTPTGTWQMQKLLEMGSIYDHILKLMSNMTSFTADELKSLFIEACEKTLEYDNKVFTEAELQPIPLSQNKALQQIVNAGLKKTNMLFDNLTKTTANTATKQFKNALDLAYQKIITGTFSYNTAIVSTIKDISKKGIQAIQYPSGHVDYLDVAVRRATLTGINQTAAEVSLANADQMECDLVEVTAHGGARTGAGIANHAGWQGKIYSRSGKIEIDGETYNDFYEVTGYGQGAGLCGWNCRHNFFPFVHGVSTRAYTQKDLDEINNKTVKYNGKDIPLYEATQMQRYQERQIRKWKREEAGLLEKGENADEPKAKIKEWQQKQRDFINETGLKRDYRRERAGMQYTGKITSNTPVNSPITKPDSNTSNAIKSMQNDAKNQRKSDTSPTQFMATSVGGRTNADIEHGSMAKGDISVEDILKNKPHDNTDFSLTNIRKNDIIKLKAKEIGIKGEIQYPPAKIDTSSLTFDNLHVNEERKHNVSMDEAKSYIENAKISSLTWNGQRIHFYSQNGVVYVDSIKNEIRTAFKSDEFDEKIKKLMEVLKEYGE